MKKILIVEDEQDVRLNLQDLLESESYQVITANDGLDGFAKAIEEKPDLIISDIKMPRMDGYEFYKQLQQNSNTINIPFIFLSARVEMSDLREGMKLGADDYLTKPFKIEEVIAAVETRLRKRDSFVLELEKLKESLLHRVPHELRTPLIGIIGFSELIEEDFNNFTSEEVKEMISRIKNSGKRLHRRIEKFLNYAELISAETKKLNEPDLMKPIFDLDSRLVLHNLQPILEDFGRFSDVQVKFANAQLHISERYFEIIIRELLENALKFSLRGTKISVNGEKDRVYYIIRVEDHGCGMSDISVKDINAFNQFSEEIYSKEGVGLGLALVQKIVNASGGYLTLKSKLNESTIVEVGLQFIKE